MACRLAIAQGIARIRRVAILRRELRRLRDARRPHDHAGALLLQCELASAPRIWRSRSRRAARMPTGCRMISATRPPGWDRRRNTALGDLTGESGRPHPRADPARLRGEGPAGEIRSLDPTRGPTQEARHRLRDVEREAAGPWFPRRKGVHRFFTAGSRNSWRTIWPPRATWKSAAKKSSRCRRMVGADGPHPPRVVPHDGRCGASSLPFGYGSNNT